VQLPQPLQQQKYGQKNKKKGQSQSANAVKKNNEKPEQQGESWILSLKMLSATIVVSLDIMLACALG
jgi:hypothetical protein